MYYITSDTSLATWLVMNQVKLINVNKSVRPVEFKFDSNDQQKLNDLIFSWDSSNAMGNCFIFFKTYRKLIHEVQDDRR